jgi:hypothetical protein
MWDASFFDDILYPSQIEDLSDKNNDVLSRYTLSYSRAEGAWALQIEWQDHNQGIKKIDKANLFII